MVKLLKRAIITEWTKIAQRFIDSKLQRVVSWSWKKLNVLGRMTVNMSNTAIGPIACIAVFIKHYYCYILLMSH